MGSEMEAAGFREIAHTADWSVEVWAPDLSGLLATSAKAMYSLMKPQTKPMVIVSKQLQLHAEDAESLLVAFLNELLFWADTESLVFDFQEIEVDSHYNLQARLNGRAVLSMEKMIKAATFHQMQVTSTYGGMTVTIVFDV